MLFALSPLCRAEESVGETIAQGVGRGMVNIVTSPAEFGHHITYDTAKMNVLGVLTGFGKGAVFMLGRCFAGLADVMTVGYIPDEYSLYKSMYMEEYVWEEDWLPPKEPAKPVKSAEVTFETAPPPKEVKASASVRTPASTQPAASVSVERKLEPMEKIYPDK
jgi:hypothetical protein